VDREAVTVAMSAEGRGVKIEVVGGKWEGGDKASGNTK
jgi:hypothetical protein